MIQLLDLPREVIRNIATHVYDPLELSQQDRLTWGIFSTVDMNQERQDELISLVNFGNVCRKIRREVRVIIHRCVRIPGLRQAEELIENKDGWAKYVKSIIIDLTMFDLDDTSRTFWQESALLTKLLNSLPSLNHLSFFADASDDTTLALLFAALIPHPSAHSVPDSMPSSPKATFKSIPLASRIHSFGWRQRAAPPNDLRQFSQASTFVSTLHLLRHAYKLSFLVLDADMDEMAVGDILVAARELSLREAPLGERAERVSLMLCGPIKGWGRDFLTDLVECFDGIKELFVDRPLRKSLQVQTSLEAFTSILSPLAELPYLRLLQVGSYTFSSSLQLEIVLRLAGMIQSLLAVGLLGEEGEVVWWGIWRGSGQGVSVQVLPLEEGHLRKLEESVVETGIEGVGDGLHNGLKRKRDGGEMDQEEEVVSNGDEALVFSD